MIKANWVVLDVETGGREPARNPITEIAAVVLDARTLNEVSRYESLVTPYNPSGEPDPDGHDWLEPGALTYTGKTRQQLNDEGVASQKVAQQLSKFLTSAKTGRFQPILVGHNVMFDYRFVDALFALHGMQPLQSLIAATLDTMTIAKLQFSDLQSEKEQVSVSLEAVAKRLGIEHQSAHNAMADVLTTAEVLRYQQQQLQQRVKQPRKQQVDNLLATDPKNQIQSYLGRQQHFPL